MFILLKRHCVTASVYQRDDIISDVSSRIIYGMCNSMHRIHRNQRNEWLYLFSDNFDDLLVKE